MNITTIKRAENPDMWNQVRRPDYFVSSNALLVTDVTKEDRFSSHTFTEIARKLMKANGERFYDCYDVTGTEVPEEYEDSLDEETDDWCVFLVSYDDCLMAEFRNTGSDADLLFSFSFMHTILH